jgi:amidase
VFELHHLTALEQREWLHEGRVSPRELADHYLARIDSHNSTLGAFASVEPDLARHRADHVATSVPRTAGLWGIPSADKELWPRIGRRATYGSRLLAHAMAEETHEMPTRLDAAGAVSLGSTTSPEFGLASTTEPLLGPIARNPYDLDRSAGGSSGGAAAAVAAGLLPFAPASDGGGSIRIPAAACGLVGLKPSRGRVVGGSDFESLAGLVVVGPIARTVADAALVLDALASSANGQFSTRAEREGRGSFLDAALRGEGRFRLGIMTDSPWDEWADIRVSSEARAALESAVAEFAALGHEVDEIAWQPEPLYGDHFRTIWMAGATGIPARTPVELDQLEPLTAWLVERGRALPAERVVESLAWLSAFERRVIRCFASVDVVVTPAVAMTPRPIGWYDEHDAEANFTQQVQYTPWTSFVNVSGLPALTLPVGLTPAGSAEPGLPMGVQLIGRPGAEATLLALGAQWEARRGSGVHPPQW